jgi:hypothetical protein
MKNWTDKVINWTQLPGTEVQRLIATWGKSPAEIARYDKKHGFENTAPKVTPQVPALEGMTPLGIKPAPAKKTAAKKAPAKAVRQKHTGADGEVKFVEHRNLYVGFYGGKVVVTKRTAEACKEVLRAQFKLEL